MAKTSNQGATNDEGGRGGGGGGGGGRPGQWYTVDSSKIRDDLLKLWVPLGAGPCRDQPDEATEIFLMRSTERSESLPLQAWHSLARSALSWFISRTSING
ncbi:hypothetical protein M0802_016540 [Mischocyttarus mexicanus]|nr:hypothetical protein M0802_016540 [Mischocyttarus mexicanus]